ncbi:MAG: hypothetical protein ABTD50_22080 [Polyangiaceae bacterium]|jgi:hypothetical protein
MSDHDCDGLLASAENRAKELSSAARQELVEDLARFLGAGSRVWTISRRTRLRRLLADAGVISLGPVLGTVADTPRDDVMDEAVAVLSSAAELHEDVAVWLIDTLGGAQGVAGPSALPPLREVMLRAIAHSRSQLARQSRVRIAFQLARDDSSPAVRDAAIQALSTMGVREGGAVLATLVESLRTTEDSPQVLESIDQALDTLRSH